MAFIKIQSANGPVFFDNSGGSLAAISDPSLIKGLQTGQIPSEEQPMIAGGAGRFSSAPSFTRAPLQFSPEEQTAPITTQPTEEQPFRYGKEQLQTFNSLMMNLLTKSQGLSSANLRAKQLDLQQEARKRLQAPTSGEFLNLSPAQQSALRQGGAKAIAGQENLVQAQLEERQAKIENLPNVLRAAVDFGKAFEEKDEESLDFATTDYKNYLLAGGEKGTGMTFLEFVDRPGTRTSGLTEYQSISRVDKLASAFDKSDIVDNFVQVQNKVESVREIIDAGVGGPGDLALIFEFMKALDPRSVVRESEYAAASRSGNIFLGVWAQFNGYFKAEGGVLPPNVKESFYKLIQIKYEAAVKQYMNLYTETSRKIDQVLGAPGIGSDFLTSYQDAFVDFNKEEEAPLEEVQESLSSAEDEAYLKSIGF